MSDAQAQLRQLHEHAKALRIDISSAKAAGAEPRLILLAQTALVMAVQFTKDAMLVGSRGLGAKQRERDKHANQPG